MIPWQSCVLWLGYPLQNGVWPDASKHDNDGVITGAVWDGDSLEFDGIDDKVNCGTHSSLDINEAITIETLIKPYTLGEGNYGRIASKAGVLEFYMTSTQRANLFLKDSLGGSHYSYTAHNSIVLNEWSHVLGTYNGAIQKMYVNSVIQPNPASWSGTIRSYAHNPTNVGNKALRTNTFDGKIALFRLYNKAFSAQQVREAFEQAYRLV